MTAGTPTVAIAHKDYDVRGGGEILAERLAQTFDAPLYTGFVTVDNRGSLHADVRPLFQHGLTGRLLRRGGLPRQLLYQYAWEAVDDLQDYDVVIQSGNEPLWYVPPDTQTTIAYTHSTPRCQYDLLHRLREQPSNRRGYLGALLAHAYDKIVRTTYYPNTAYPDLYVANSELVERRIQRYWGIPDRRTCVVHPPVPTSGLDPSHAADALGDYYLSINRLDEWKRIDELVDAFHQLDERLVIAGTGPEEDALRERARGHDNITFVGYLSDQEKRQYLASAKAVVYAPVNEDFGMVPVEALASGTPVIAAADGYQPWQLDDGRTGILFERSTTDRDITVRNCRRAVRQYEAEGVTADESELAAEAAAYSVPRFEAEMEAAVSMARERARVVPKDEREPLATPDNTTVAQTEEEAALTDGGDST